MFIMLYIPLNFSTRTFQISHEMINLITVQSDEKIHANSVLLMI